MNRFWTKGGEPGYWLSVDGRFSISPQFEGTTRPQSYRVTDSRGRLGHRAFTCDKVREAKYEVERLLNNEAKRLAETIRRA